MVLYTALVQGLLKREKRESSGPLRIRRHPALTLVAWGLGKPPIEDCLFSTLCLQDRPGHKQLSTLTETILKGSPFPKLRAKAAECKALLQPVAAALMHFRDQDPSKGPLLTEMVAVLNASHGIDALMLCLMARTVLA